MDSQPEFDWKTQNRNTLESSMFGKCITIGSLIAIAAVGLAATQEKPKLIPAGAPVAVAPAAKTYSVDDVHSSALFRVHHAGAGQFWGRFNNVSGTFTLCDEPSKMSFDITVAVDSVDTGEPKLDGHLKSPDFFNSKEFPNLTFKSTKVTRTSSSMFEVSGEFSMHGVTKSITASLEITGQADMGMGARGGAEAIFTVRRSDFGMNYGVEKGMVGDAVRVVVNLEGVQAKG
jgi:polyisoprenoid-binding protein YceI